LFVRELNAVSVFVCELTARQRSSRTEANQRVAPDW